MTRGHAFDSNLYQTSAAIQQEVDIKKQLETEQEVKSFVTTKYFVQSLDKIAMSPLKEKFISCFANTMKELEQENSSDKVCKSLTATISPIIDLLRHHKHKNLEQI